MLSVHERVILSFVTQEYGTHNFWRAEVRRLSDGWTESIDSLDGCASLTIDIPPVKQDKAILHLWILLIDQKVEVESFSEGLLPPSIR